MDRWSWAAKGPRAPKPSTGPSWGRETAVNDGQSRCLTDNQTGSWSAIIGRDGAVGPYMACKRSSRVRPAQLPSPWPRGRAATEGRSHRAAVVGSIVWWATVSSSAERASRWLVFCV
jgi:hypothetical protein